MDAARIIGDPISRRRFFLGAGITLGAGSATFAAACGDDEEGNEGSASDAEETADVGILNSALALELTAVDAYREGLARLNGAVLAVGERFLIHEQEHANGLTEAIKQRGATTDARPMRLDYSGLRDSDDVLRFAIGLEEVAIAAYVDAVPRLSSPDLRATVSQIATNEAEHLSVLRQALGREPAPQAFVTGDAEALGALTR